MDAQQTAGTARDRTACAAAEGCAESRLLISRRSLFGVTAGLFSWAYMPAWAEAAGGADPRLLVVVLRGGMDGLSVVVPHGDKNYASLRGNIAIPKSSTIQLNSLFGLHPAMKTLGSLYKAGEAAMVHATCVPLRNRSHFDGQDNLENGQAGLVSNSTGWLNRLLGALPKGAPILKHGAIQIGPAPLILRGPAPVLGWSPAYYDHLDGPLLYMVRTLYREKDPEMYAFLERGLEADRLAEGVDKDDGNISALRKGFRGAARLLRSSKGPRIAVLSVDGWDTHADQGNTTGQLADLLGELDGGIADFKKEAGPTWSRTVMVLATEFGRTARVNGDSGTDHGVGTVALLAGGAVNGKRVLGDWPGLAPGNLYEGSDLRATTDLRAVFKGVLRDHLDVPATILNGTVFPGSGGVAPMKNLLRSASAASEAETASGPLLAPLRAEPPIARYRRGEPVSPEPEPAQAL